MLPSRTLVLQGLTFELGFGTEVEGLHDPRIHRGNDIDGAIEIVLSNAGLPCVRKAAFHSGLAVAHQGDGQAHKDCLALAQIGDGVGLTVQLPEISSLAHVLLLIEVPGL